MSSRTASLHISTIVHGRQKHGTRVTYLQDPKGQGTVRHASESIVLKRWRARRRDGCTFSGARLAPSLWRALPAAFGPDVAMWPTLDEAAIELSSNATRPALREAHLSLPAAEIVHALIAVCGVERLRQLVLRHAEPARWKSPGVPDLFLFMRDATQRVSAARFVEVKRPDEPFRPGQEEEIPFMTSLGLETRVLRLIERPANSGRGTGSPATVTTRRERNA